MAELHLRDNQLLGWGPHSPCLRCGAPATCVVPKTFTLRQASGRYYPSSLLRLIDLLQTLFAPRRKQMNVPLCDHHKGHWRRHRWIMAGFAGAEMALLLLLAGGFVHRFGSLLDIQNKDVVGYLLLAFLGLSAALLIPAAIWIKPPIRAKWIDDRGITLTGVADTFPGVEKPG